MAAEELEMAPPDCRVLELPKVTVPVEDPTVRRLLPAVLTVEESPRERLPPAAVNVTAPAAAPVELIFVNAPKLLSPADEVTLTAPPAELMLFGEANAPEPTFILAALKLTVELLLLCIVRVEPAVKLVFAEAVIALPELKLALLPRTICPAVDWKVRAALLLETVKPFPKLMSLVEVTFTVAAAPVLWMVTLLPAPATILPTKTLTEPPVLIVSLEPIVSVPVVTFTELAAAPRIDVEAPRVVLVVLTVMLPEVWMVLLPAVFNSPPLNV